MRSDPESEPQPVALPWFALHVFALSGFALAQPVYSWVSAQPEFLAAHGLEAGKALLVVTLLSLVIPAVLVAGVWCFRLAGRKALFVAQIVLIALLAGVFGLHALPLQAVWPVVLFMFTVAGGLAYWRLPLFRQLLSGLALLALFLPVVFVLTEPVRGMVLTGDKRGLVESGAQRSADPQELPPVVMVMLDEVSMPAMLDASGEIDAGRFPGFARLADASTWYPRATTVHSGTTVSTITLVTGQAPGEGRFTPSWHEYPRNLFTWLPTFYDGDFRVGEYFSNLCPYFICTDKEVHAPPWPVLVSDLLVLTGHAVVPDRYAGMLPALDERLSRFVDWGFLPESERPPAILGLLAFDRGDVFRQAVETMHRRPEAFYFEHLYLPHVPLEYLPQGERYETTLNDQGYRSDFDERIFAALEYQRHLAQLQYADSLVGHLIDRLQASGKWDEMLLIVLADHGRSFRRDSHWRLLDPDSAGEVLNVPLFVKAPGQRDGRVDRYPASMIDILPTVADVLGHAPPWEMDGVSLLAGDRPERTRIPVSCHGLVGCSPEFIASMPYIDSAGVRWLEVERLDQKIEASRQWLRAHRRYSEAVNLFVPDVPESQLLGQSVSDYTRHAPQGQVSLFAGEGLRAGSVPDEGVPALVAGYARDVTLEADEFLLLAADGRISALVEVEKLDGKTVVAGLLPARVFTAGVPELTFYRVLWADGQVKALVPVPPDYR